MKESVKTVESGVKYKTSRISYVTNYSIFILLVVFLFLLWQKFNLNLDFTLRSTENMVPFLVFSASLIIASYLLEEATIERIIRQYFVTDNEVIKLEGFLRKKRVVIPYQSVADVRVTKGVIGRIFNFGDVEVTGFKDAIVVKGVKDPDEICRIIQSKISRFRGGPRIHKPRVEE